MCIALLTTAHPKYALIVINNRDEFILRPTCRPYWWKHQESGHDILSARDLQRKARGTWLGVSKQGRLAVLTNYREVIPETEHPIHGIKSRGAMISAWLGAPDDESLDGFVQRMLKDRLMKGVGGFSLICGNLRKKGQENIEPLVIISNRSEEASAVPRIGGERGKTWGLSNTIYVDPATWKKVILGKQLLHKTVEKAAEAQVDEEELLDRLFGILDTNTLESFPSMDFEDMVDSLKQSIFVPAFGDEVKRADMVEAAKNIEAKAAFAVVEDATPEEKPGDEFFSRGTYGTQRQTVLLVDWNGEVTYKERALFDAHGNAIERGKGDETFKFKIDNWDEQ